MSHPLAGSIVFIWPSEGTPQVEVTAWLCLTDQVAETSDVKAQLLHDTIRDAETLQEQLETIPRRAGLPDPPPPPPSPSILQRCRWRATAALASTSRHLTVRNPIEYFLEPIVRYMKTFFHFIAMIIVFPIALAVFFFPQFVEIVVEVAQSAAVRNALYELTVQASHCVALLAFLLVLWACIVALLTLLCVIAGVASVIAGLTIFFVPLPLTERLRVWVGTRLFGGGELDTNEDYESDNDQCGDQEDDTNQDQESAAVRNALYKLTVFTLYMLYVLFLPVLWACIVALLTLAFVVAAAVAGMGAGLATFFVPLTLSVSLCVGVWTRLC